MQSIPTVIFVRTVRTKVCGGKRRYLLKGGGGCEGPRPPRSFRTGRCPIRHQPVRHLRRRHTKCRRAGSRPHPPARRGIPHRTPEHRNPREQGCMSMSMSTRTFNRTNKGPVDFRLEAPSAQVNVSTSPNLTEATVAINGPAEVVDHVKEQDVGGSWIIKLPEDAGTTVTGNFKIGRASCRDRVKHRQRGV